jgi:hypothetical protein
MVGNAESSQSRSRWSSTTRETRSRQELMRVSQPGPTCDRPVTSQSSTHPVRLRLPQTCSRTQHHGLYPWSTLLWVYWWVCKQFRVISRLRRTVIPPLRSTLSTMAASEAVTMLAKGSAAVISNAPEALQTSLAAMKAAETAPSSTFGILGRSVLSILSVLPTVLFWLSYTLPTWLFTLFSMSLTFTMNFTTL